MPRMRGAGWLAGREAEAEHNRQIVEDARAEARQRRLEREAMTASHRRRMVDNRAEGSKHRRHRRRQQPQHEDPQDESTQFEEPQFEEPHYQPLQYELPQYEAPQYEPPQYEAHDEDDGDEDEGPAEMHIDDDAQAEGGPGPFPGGPSVTSLLPSFGDHIAYRLWHGQDREEPLRVFALGKRWQRWFEHRQPLPPAVAAHVERAGLSSLMYCTYGMVDSSLLTAFSERWHRETSSFHLPFGEMTITLDDVSCLLGIPISGALFRPPEMDMDIAISVMQSLLGASYDEAQAAVTSTGHAAVSLSWLQDIYDARREAGQMDQAARALMMVLLGMTLLTDKTSTRIDCRYIELLRDLQQVGQWSWGVMALCQLYSYLGDATRFECRGLAGYMTLFQAWIYAYFSASLVPRKDVAGGDEVRVAANRWRSKRGHGKVLPYRQALDRLTPDDVCWRPWEPFRQYYPFNQVSWFSGYLRCGSTIVPYLPERVMRQFGYKQLIPRAPLERPDDDAITVRWMSFHLYTIRYLCPLEQAKYPADCVPQYMDWYYRRSHPLLIPPQAPPPQAPPPHAPHPQAPPPQADYIDARQRLDRVAAMLHQVREQTSQGYVIRADELCDYFDAMIRIAEYRE